LKESAANMQASRDIRKYENYSKATKLSYCPVSSESNIN